jgi:carbonic anhydrase
LGLIENWLRHIQDAARHRRTVLENLSSHEQKVDRLCELNVIEQALNVAETTVIEAAWARKQNVTIHGWIYDIKDGRLRDLKVSMSGEEDLKRLRAV